VPASGGDLRAARGRIADLFPHCLPHRLFSSHTAAGNLQEVIAAQRQVLPIVDPLSAKPPKADIAERD